MLPRLAVVAIPVLLLAGCDEMMMPVSADSVGTAGAVDVNTTATTPEGIVAAQVAVQDDAGECGRLALIIESSDSTATAVQAAQDRRMQIGCP